MDDRNRRRWSVATDRLGPNTKVRPRLTKRGIGGVLAVLGNPVSFTVDPVIGCLPWISLRGGRDAQSAAVRDALINQDEGTAFSIPNGLDTTAAPPTNGGAPAPPSASTGGGGASGTTPTGGNRTAPTTGPFGYIGAVK